MLAYAWILEETHVIPGDNVQTELQSGNWTHKAVDVNLNKMLTSAFASYTWRLSVYMTI